MGGLPVGCCCQAAPGLLLDAKMLLYHLPPFASKPFLPIPSPPIIYCPEWDNHPREHSSA